MNNYPRFALSADLGNGLENESRDVEAAKRGLFQLGYYSPPDFGFTGILDRELDEGLRSFQRDRGLKVDGLARPGGETETALAAASGPGPTQTAQAAAAQTQTPKYPPEFQAKLDAAQDHPLFQKFLDNLKVRESVGYSNSPIDRGGPTNTGVSQDTLDDIHEQNKYPELNLPTDVANLTQDLIDKIYALEYFAQPHIPKLAEIFKGDEQLNLLTEQVFDAGVLHSTQRAGAFLQKALDETLGTDLREVNSKGELEHDGIVGPKTRAAVQRALDEGKLWIVNNRVANIRELAMEETMANDPTQEGHRGGWLARARSFSVSTHPGMPLHRNWPLK